MHSSCRGTKRGIDGSAISTAVASRVLVKTNEPGRLDENTAKVVAPLSPATSDVTSAATDGFLNGKRYQNLSCTVFIKWVCIYDAD